MDRQADSREQLHCSKPMSGKPQFALWGWVFPQDHTQSFLSLPSPGPTLLAASSPAARNPVKRKKNRLPGHPVPCSWSDWMFRRAREAVSGDSLGPDGGGNIYFAGINITEKTFRSSGSGVRYIFLTRKSSLVLKKGRQESS